MDVQPAQRKKNIVILGAGFGGIACALRLERLFRTKRTLFGNFAIVLVDRRNFHLWTPALYDVATTASDDASPLNIKKAVTIPVEEITAKKRIVFLQGKVLKVNIAQKQITFDDETVLEYAYLVFALGSEPAHFGIPGVKEHSISLKGLDDAIHIRSTIRKKYDEKREGGEVAVVIGGGGPTGVEFAAELTGYLRELNRKHSKGEHVAVTLIEGAPSILPGFDQWTIRKATERLTSLGVHLKTGHLVARADSRTVYVKSSTDAPEEGVLCDVFIWSGGVQAVNVMSSGDLSLEKRGRFETDPSMTCISPDKHLDVAKNVFAIGDNACFYNPVTHRPVPATARLAIEQGKVAAANIFRDILGKPRKAFKAWKYPYVIPLGGKYAVAEIGPFKLRGVLAWFFHELVELYYLIVVSQNNWKALKRWWRGLEIFSKND